MVKTLSREHHPVGTKLLIKLTPVGVAQPGHNQGLHEIELLAWSRPIAGQPVLVKFNQLPGVHAITWIEVGDFNNRYEIVTLVEEPLKAPEAVIQIFEVVGRFADALKEIANPKGR